MEKNTKEGVNAGATSVECYALAHARAFASE